MIVEYEHHGTTVRVDEELKGKHRQHCLCWECRRFEPGWSLHAIMSCVRAKILYLFCVVFGMTTPVYECPKYANVVFVGKGPAFSEAFEILDLT